MKRIYDERNLIFSRARLKKGTKAYIAYYNKHPRLKSADDDIRGMNINEKLRQSETFKSLFFPIHGSTKTLFKALHDAVDQAPLGKRVDVPAHFKKNIKAITKHYGAKDVGVVKLHDSHYYSHFGGTNTLLNLDNYGQAITSSYTHAIVYLIPMDLEHMNRAPNYEEQLETENAYLNIAYIGSRLALYLKSLGYKSTLQSETYYLTPLVPLALDAGLGEIGMTNHIVHPKYGNRIRLGAVLTNLALPADQPIDFGLEAFCKRCALCVMNCPSRSITPYPRIVNGRRFYKFDDVSCFKLWKNTGTDCGTCIQSCPFTQGIDPETIKNMQKDPRIIDDVIKDYLAKNGRRKYRKTPLDIVALEDET